MKFIETAFIIFIMSVLVYSWVTPGQQLPPRFWNYDPNWKPTPFTWAVIGISSIFLILLKGNKL